MLLNKMEKAYRLVNSYGCEINSILTDKELNEFLKNGWNVEEQLNPKDYRIG